MAFDLRLVAFREVLEVIEVRALPGVAPRTVEVTGPNMSFADMVRINGFFSPDVIVLDQRTLLAQVPESQLSQLITHIEVFSGRVSSFRSNRIDFILGPGFRATRGEEKLLQAFLLSLMQSTNSDMYHPNRGGGVFKMAGQTMSVKDKGGLANQLKVAVLTTSEQMLYDQSLVRSLPPSETLAFADVDSISVDPGTTSMVATLRVLSIAGGQAEAALET